MRVNTLIRKSTERRYMHILSMQGIEMILSGSDYLFEALDHKVSFKEMKVLVPPNWKKGKYESARTETFNKARIRIDSPHPAFGDDPYTHQTKGCGCEGEYIHFTPNYLLNNHLIKAYGPRGRVFEHEWAHLRWGVFDEYNKREPFYMSVSGQIQSTSCSDKISGQWYEIINQSLRPCQNLDAAGKPTSSCVFFPHAVQKTNPSIMYMQSIVSARAFCREEEHNAEAPNEQNEKCSRKATRTVIFQESVDKHALLNLKHLPSTPPAPTFKAIQRGPRVVCLILNVSGSISGRRIELLQQAATIFLKQIIEEQQFVALVTFSTEAQILTQITLIDGPTSRDNLINKVPKTAAGSTYICKGIRKGLEALRKDETIGDEVIFPTDGEATDNVTDFLQAAVHSGAIIHTIGTFIVSKDSIRFNQLVDAFSSMTMFYGNPITQPIQLESTGTNVADWFNGTVPVDRTVGNHTSFILIYERSAPTVYIESPSGLVYDQTHTTDIANTITCTVPETAETLFYLNRDTVTQQVSLTIMSRAAREDVHPIAVRARMNQQTSDGTKPMTVLAHVSQNYNPVFGVSVWANLESDTGHSVQRQLLDNGAGADVFKDDGAYSRYFPNLRRGKYSLKVRVENQHGGGQFSPHRHSGALYVPGYIVDGEVELNPPKPPVNQQPVDVGSFTRTITGESFIAEADAPSNFPPNKITDLTAEIQEDTMRLNWTAPGDDYDQGTAQSYEMRWSEDLKTLQHNFSSANLFNTSALLPQESGSAERHSFQLNITIKNGITLFFAVQAVDQHSAKSEVSHIARATKYVASPKRPPIPNPDPKPIPIIIIIIIIISVCVVIIVTCVIAVIITLSALKQKDIIA
ncbi:LOW QUALITY PROTEIN: calcium-activated chloride channel regulator 3A-1-like [Ictalurus furcatus]|uniref:LOW QUALITY PROTEIN: calcium-activated chloride channel regulator 3A-1-like n=1 Tax=Ictalurus furcatus TaxID=66913 RepID=UPI0023505E0A|nr:LOW QUALITY PROTEIN: calcium-activated chloride channel regulator 3A-1-like [Ictalurus furcatus]